MPQEILSELMSSLTVSLKNQYAIFEPGTRNTGTAIAGKNIANPISMLNASVDLLHHLKLEQHASWLEEAIDKTINEDRIHTPGWYLLAYV